MSTTEVFARLEALEAHVFARLEALEALEAHVLNLQEALLQAKNRILKLERQSGEHQRYIRTGQLHKWCEKCENYVVVFSHVYMQHAKTTGEGIFQRSDLEPCENSLKPWGA